MLPPEELEAAGLVVDELDDEGGVEDDDAEEEAGFDGPREESLDAEFEPSRRSPRRESPPLPPLERPRSPSPNRRQRSRRSSRLSPPPDGGCAQTRFDPSMRPAMDSGPSTVAHNSSNLMNRDAIFDLTPPPTMSSVQFAFRLFFYCSHARPIL